MKCILGSVRPSRSMLAGALALLLAGVALPPAASAGTLSTHTLISKLQWRNVGPYIGGRVVAVDGVSGKPDLFYMGSVDGGVWKSTNYGTTWKNISDGWPSSSNSIGAIAVAPSNPKVIYVGTGESDIRGDMITGDGIFKSTDGGKSWHYAGLKDTHTTMSLVVDPHNPDVVYAASMGHVFLPGSHRGVFKSTDGGKSWHKVLFINKRTGVVDLVMDPKNPQVLYAAAWQAYRKPWKLMSGGPGSGIYKSTDGGKHWTNITGHEGLPTGTLGKIGLGVAPSNPQVVYAAIQAKQGGVFKSTDGGKSFKRVNDNWKLRQRAFYYTAIFVDPTNPDTVYMPQVDALFVSHDGGKKFTKLHTPHGDNHIVWINPNNPKILLEGNDGGATVSVDGGKTWSTEHNQPTGQYYSVNLDNQFPFHIYGAQQDEGAFEGPSAKAGGHIPLSAWHRTAFGESTWVVPQPNNPKINYGSGYYSIFVKYNMHTEQYESVSPWPNYKDGAASDELKYRFGWTHPILFSPADPKELLIGSQYVMKSDDYGRTWKTISPDLTRNNPRTEAPTGGPIDLDQSGAEIYPGLSSLAVSPLDNDIIWAGSSDGLVHVTTDGGRHWREVRPAGLPKWSRISSIEPSYVHKGTAYMSARRYMWDDFSPYVYKTTDYGRHWTKITRGLPGNQYVFHVTQDPKDPKLLFLGTKNTVYVSFDGGGHWQALALNLPKVQVRDVAINNRQGSVVIATHGRAFWVLDNLKLLEQMTGEPGVSTGQPALFTPQMAWLTKAYGTSGYPSDNAGKNPRFGAAVFFHVPGDYAGKTPVTLSFTDAQGHLIRSFTLHLKHKAGKKQDKGNLTPQQKQERAERKLTAIKPGMNRFQWNLRYPDATRIKGFYPPEAAGGLAPYVYGPQVVPGTYHVVLDYGGHKTMRTFKVSLDPRIDSTQADLEASLALQLRIHNALNTLDQKINQAMDLRDQLRGALADHKVKATAARAALNELDREINTLVQMNIHSSEGDLLHQPRLHSLLAYLQTDIGMAYVRPKPAQYAVFRYLNRQAEAGEQRLQSAMEKARKAM